MTYRDPNQAREAKALAEEADRRWALLDEKASNKKKSPHLEGNTQPKTSRIAKTIVRWIAMAILVGLAGLMVVGIERMDALESLREGQVVAKEHRPRTLSVQCTPGPHGPSCQTLMHPETWTLTIAQGSFWASWRVTEDAYSTHEEGSWYCETWSHAHTGRYVCQGPGHSPYTYTRGYQRDHGIGAP